MANNKLSFVGKKYLADFGEKTFQLYYENENTLELIEVKGPNTGRRQVLSVRIVKLRPRLFMVNWQEENKLTVTDIEDYEKGTVYANLTTPKDKFENLKGTLTLIEQRQQ